MAQVKTFSSYERELLEQYINEFLKEQSKRYIFDLKDIKYSCTHESAGDYVFSAMIIYED